MIEHCLSALRKDRAERDYRTYLTDALKAIVDNTSRHVVPGHGEVRIGSELTRRWIKPPDYTPEPETDNRDCAEIVSGIWARMKGGPDDECI